MGQCHLSSATPCIVCGLSLCPQMRGRETHQYSVSSATSDGSAYPLRMEFCTECALHRELIRSLQDMCAVRHGLRCLDSCRESPYRRRRQRNAPEVAFWEISPD